MSRNRIIPPRILLLPYILQLRQSQVVRHTDHCVLALASSTCIVVLLIGDIAGAGRWIRFSPYVLRGGCFHGQIPVPFSGLVSPSMAAAAGLGPVIWR